MIVERSQRLADGVASASLVQSGPHEARSVSSTTRKALSCRAWSQLVLCRRMLSFASLSRGRIVTARAAREAVVLGSVCPIRTFLVTLLEDGMAELSPRLSLRPSFLGGGPSSLLRCANASAKAAS